VARTDRDKGTAETGPDLADRAMSAIDQLVDTVHDKVIRPILLVARVVAASFLLAICVIVLLIALGVGLLRFLDVYAFASHQWLSYGVMGALSTIIGLAFWRRRRASAAP
jgi:broad specificity phosphatase PhoE